MPMPSGIAAKMGRSSGAPGLPSEFAVTMSHHNANMAAATIKPAMMNQVPDRCSSAGVRLVIGSPSLAAWSQVHLPVIKVA